MSLPNCPQGCESNIPVVEFDKCSPDVKNGQIEYIFITKLGEPLVNWRSELEWDSRIDNSGSAANAIRMLTVIGEMPIPESSEKEISSGRKVQGVRKFIINADIDEMNDTNHNLIRELQCNSGKRLVWFQTRDGLLFGDTSGVEANIKADIIIPKSYTDLILGQLVIEWDGNGNILPERITSPITENTGNQ